MGDNWSIEPIGLVLGYNLITVTAVCKDGEEVSETLFIMNFNEENMADADVDLSDTDENGVNDGKEDLDEDGLTNLEEVQLGTDARFEDSDGDKLLDGEEVNRYGTDPMVPDHDEDGLLDGEDVLMGFEPLNPDTDGDGILDGDEVVYQTCVEEIDQERVAGITQVAVSMDCAGFIENEVSIFNVYNLDMRTTDVVGLVGAPVEIETEQEFDEATIVFTYDEAALGETSEDNLRIMWYDEENDEYILLDEETVIDKENNTLSCTTNHFSTWLVVDVLRWLEALSVELNYGNILYEQRFRYATAYLFYDNSLYNREENKVTKIRYGMTEAVYSKHEWDAWDSGSTNSNRVLEFDEAFEFLLTKLNGLRESGYRKQLYIICADDVEYNSEFVEKANSMNVSINFITKFAGSKPNMEKMAKETSGKFFKAPNWSTPEIDRIIGVQRYKVCEKLLNDDYTDFDWDNLFNIFEDHGMLISNGTVVRTSSLVKDSDYDDINDFIEMGGLPEEVTYTYNGRKHSFLMFKGSLYEQLSEEFIFVDGTPNKDGTVNNEKMDYVPYLEEKNRIPWYGKDELEPDMQPTKELLGVTRPYNGFDEIHNLFQDMKNDKRLDDRKREYFVLNTLALYVTSVAKLEMARDCFWTYKVGRGGSAPGILNKGTRKYVDSSKIVNKWFCNSANENYRENMLKALNASISVLNRYNTEVYIAVSPNANWEGCLYGDKYNDAKEIFQILTNLDTFGTFNKADAVMTLYCAYDPEKELYYAYYKYYLTDYYNFDIAPQFEEQNMIGETKSYELYGVTDGIIVFGKNDSLYLKIPNIF